MASTDSVKVLVVGDSGNCFNGYNNISIVQIMFTFPKLWSIHFPMNFFKIIFFSVVI